MRYIDPVRDIADVLSSVEKPARYTGGEFGSLPACRDPGRYIVAICFPDLYEIGMSNTAIRLLYSMINRIPGVRAERVFAPAPDFEKALSERELPLYTLESGIPLRECDLVAFSIGYELSATNVLAVLDAGRIPMRSTARYETDPIVIAGGPGVSNPVPFGVFLDAVFIGEAEQGFPEIVETLRDLKRRKAGRTEKLEAVREDPGVWWPGKTGATRRAVWTGFAEDERELEFPVSGIKAVQDHGTVEIMRGCPHGCRFCHAGVFYRPYRMKPRDRIIAETDRLVHHFGYREITLSSLSTGDYRELTGLVHELNRRYQDEKVSFALPSLRISTLTLPLLEQVCYVRKSGLTFAIETPTSAGQREINKIVDRDRTIEILKEAKSQGWKSAKFYFMIGLPVSGRETDAEDIADFLLSVRAETGVQINCTVSTFVPKPHTPFQWAEQLGEQEALSRIYRIRNALAKKSIKFTWNSPFQSTLEGVIARGDERVGELILDAYRRGARMDAWDDMVSRETWRTVWEESGWDPVGVTLRQRLPGQRLPWSNIRSLVSERYLRREWERAELGELSERCEPDCPDLCGVCNKRIRVDEPVDRNEEKDPEVPVACGVQDLPVTTVGESRGVQPVMVRFRKTGPAVFLPHLAVVTAWDRALLRAGLPARFSEGFNPHPRIEFASPISVGVPSREEYLRFELSRELPPEAVLSSLVDALPAGIEPTGVWVHSWIPDGLEKPPSLMSVYWGASYRVEVPASFDTGLVPVQAMIERIRAAGFFVSSDINDVLNGSVDATRQRQGRILDILCPAATGQGSLLKVVRGILERDPLSTGLKVQRTSTYARDENGNRVSYPACFGLDSAEFDNNSIGPGRTTPASGA